MKKKLITVFMIIFLLSGITKLAFAEMSNPDLKVNITSPNGVKDYPGREETIKVAVKNNGKNDLKHVLAYITMADLNKNMTVNLEDYSADKPIYIEKIKPGSSCNIELPIRFVYTSKYHLYVTVVSKDDNRITSSAAIPINIMGNTKISKPMTMGVSFVEPVIIVFGAILVYNLRKRKSLG
jgi:uncharacterized membrane protein